jgi:ribose 5-phosphate isomerase B
MKIYFASDHAGFEMKKLLVAFVKEADLEVVDLGPEEFDESDDYPLFIEKAGLEVFKNPDDTGAIIIGGSGQGEAIVANRFPNVRAAVFYGGNMEIIKLAREHNDSNILSLGARFLSDVEAKEAVKLWLETPFSGDKRHIRRLEEIDKLEESLYKNP